MLGEINEQLRAAFSGALTIDRELGGGGMSRVFLATDQALNRQIVIKTLPPELSSAIGLERFRREIEVAARLQHPHIVPLITAGVAAGAPYYTMPYVEGESLRDRLTRDGPLPIIEIVQILREVVDALSYAHGRGVVHRDIKPENILIANRHALVTDFGVAKAVAAATTAGSDQPGTGTITQLGVTVGTPAYMAPEQVSADPNVDHRADLYSFGIVGYEMIIGTPPFAGMPAARMLAAHITSAPTPIQQSRPDVPVELANLILRCLAKSPDDRPASATEVCDELDTIAAEAAVKRPRRPRRKWVVGAGAALAVGAVIAAAALAPSDLGPMVRRLMNRTPAVLRPGKVTIAPILNETGDTSLNRFGGYAAAQIADALGLLGRFEVVDATSAMLNDTIMKRVPMLTWFRSGSRAIADQTGASIVVQSTMYRDGDSLRVKTRIHDYGSESIRRSMPEVAGLYRDKEAVLTALIKRLVGTLGQAADTSMIATLGAYGDPPSIDAYYEVRSGVLAYVGFSPTYAVHYRRAEEIDSNYVTPKVLLALAATFREQKPMAESAVVRAHRLRDRMTPPEAAILAHVEANLVADRDSIFRSAKRLLTAVPGSLELPLLAAGAMLFAGQPAEAIASLNRTDPDRGLNLASSYYWRNMGEARHQLGDHEGSLEVFRAGLARYPKDARLSEWEATELVDLSRDAEIDEAIERGRTDSTQLAIAAGAVDALRARARDTVAKAMALRWLERLAATPPEAPQTRYNLARLHGAAEHWDSVRTILRPMVGTGGILAREALTLDAVAAAKKGDPAVAKRADSLLAAVSDRFDNGRAEFHRAELAAARGDRAGAESRLRAAMRKGFALQYTTWPIERSPFLALFRDTDWFSPTVARERFAR